MSAPALPQLLTKLLTSFWSASRSVPCLGVPKIMPFVLLSAQSKASIHAFNENTIILSKREGKRENRYKKEQQQQLKLILQNYSTSVKDECILCAPKWML